MLIRNKKQNTKWEISDQSQIKRLLADPDYEEVKTEKKGKEPEKSG